jgi:hypothetical protein
VLASASHLVGTPGAVPITFENPVMAKFGTARSRGSGIAVEVVRTSRFYVSYVHGDILYIRSAIAWDWGPDKRKAGLLFGGGDS